MQRNLMMSFFLNNDSRLSILFKKYTWIVYKVPLHRAYAMAIQTMFLKIFYCCVTTHRNIRIYLFIVLENGYVCV